MLQEEDEEKKGQDVIEECTLNNELILHIYSKWKMSNSEGSVNKREMGKSLKKLKRKFETMKGYEGDKRIMFEFILKGFAESDIWDKVNEPLSPKLNEDE
ncbi:hypothetical protein Tco_0634452 [Tanacetum coccineum]